MTATCACAVRRPKTNKNSTPIFVFWMSIVFREFQKMIFDFVMTKNQNYKVLN
jgi:hypothetical protein